MDTCRAASSDLRVGVVCFYAVDHIALRSSLTEISWFLTDRENHKMTTPVEDFKRFGDKASFHYADDSGREWGLADTAKQEALRIFDANPDDQPEMREIAIGFLWGGEMKQLRPESPATERDQ